MYNFSNYLKNLRIDSNLTLKQLSAETNITDSRLSKLENGIPIKDINKILLKLSDFYKINIIEFFIQAKIISIKDINNYGIYLAGLDRLSQEELKHIQNEIDLFIKLKTEGEK